MRQRSISNAGPLTAKAQEIRRFHKLGNLALILRPSDERAVYPGRGNKDKTIAAEAKSMGLSVELLRRARKFAVTYTESEVNAMLADCRKYKAVHFGISHVWRLLAVTDAQGKPDRKRRRELEKRAIREGRSQRWIAGQAMIGQGNRRARAGRKIKPPQTPSEAAYLLQRAGGMIHRLKEAIDAVQKKLPQELVFWMDRLDGDATEIEEIARKLLREAEE